LADASDVRKAAAAGMKRGEPALLAPFCGSALLCARFLERQDLSDI